MPMQINQVILEVDIVELTPFGIVEATLDGEPLKFYLDANLTPTIELADVDQQALKLHLEQQQPLHQLLTPGARSDMIQNKISAFGINHTDL